MTIHEKRVLEGTRDDMVAHITAKMREESEAAAADRGPVKTREAHAAAANALAWVLTELEAWVETKPVDDNERPTSGPGSAVEMNGATEAVRREAAAGAL